ncbi:hypothetical protein QZH41_016914 [Actinostola sp. cb2023]|nr:hypothetical protein QZH41_016914 [Actinostola sp. cb2023]
MTIKITSLNYTSDLANKQSAARNTLTEKIKSILKQNLTANTIKYVNIHSFEFRPGSVISTYYVDYYSGASSGLKEHLQQITNTTSFGSYTIEPAFSTVKQVVVVDGGWSNYSTWPSTSSASSAKCGKNFQVSRTRTCNKPSPQNGGKLCTGPTEEFKPCEWGGKYDTAGAIISSPYWPSKYPCNVDSLWVLVAPSNHTVELRIEQFQLETDKKCFYDYVEIFDGNSTKSPVLMTRTCGSKGVNRTIQSTDTTMTVHFKSDRTVIFKGFKATWNKVVKPWKRPKPIQYKEQNVTVTNVISCPTYNDTFVTLGRATTCSTRFYCIVTCSDCISGVSVHISCMIGVTTNRNDLPMRSSSKLNITFKHVMMKDLFPSYYLKDKTCVTWNTTRLSKGNGRAWTKNGCSVLSTNMTHTTCQCDHTGIFAVVVTDKVVHTQFSLLANTYAGIGVAFLIIIVAITHIVWKIDIHGGEVMRMNICVAIILMMMTFLIGANVKAEKTLCGFLAFLEYFSVMSQFFWLMLHGLRIHGKIKEIFASGLNIEIVYVVFGWGLPLLLSLIAIGIQVDIKNPNDVCWTAIAGEGMWGYGGPLLIVVMLNLTVLAAVIVPTEERKTKYDYEPMMYRVFKDAILLALFGFTCIMAYLTVIHETFKTQYFLTVSVVLQGTQLKRGRLKCN